MPLWRDVRPWMFVAVFACIGAVAPPARAEGTMSCVDAAEKAQQLRNAGRFTEAREQLVVCGSPNCPRLIQADCTKWMSELRELLPSIVPGAKDHLGRDLVDVKVSLDDEVLTEALDGKPIPLDPGVYVIRFETEGAPPVEDRLVVRQGEQGRHVSVSFAAPGDSPASAAQPSVGEDAPPIAAYVSGGAGLLALGAGLFINLDANGDARSMRDSCAPHCSESDVDDVRTRQVAGGITAAIGGAALVTGVVLYMLQRGSSASTALHVTPGVAARGALAGAAFRF